MGINEIMPDGYDGCSVVGVDFADGEDSCGEEIYDIPNNVVYDAGVCDIKVEKIEPIRLSIIAANAIEEWKRRNMFIFGHGGGGKSLPVDKNHLQYDIATDPEFKNKVY